MSPDEVLALLQIIARQQLQINALETALAHAQQAAQQQPTPQPDPGP